MRKKGKYVNMEDRFGKTEIRKIGAAGGMVTFGFRALRNFFACLLIDAAFLRIFHVFS